MASSTTATTMATATTTQPRTTTTTTATTEDKKNAFNKAVAHVLKSWTCLTLAVNHSWGGRNSEKKKDDLYNLLLNLFYSSANDFIQLEHKKVTCGSIVGSSENLADFLLDKLETEFHIEIDEEDPIDEFIEVADILRKLANTLKLGDFSFYDQVMKQRSDGHLRSLAAIPDHQPDSASSEVVDSASSSGEEDNMCDG